MKYNAISILLHKAATGESTITFLGKDGQAVSHSLDRKSAVELGAQLIDSAPTGVSPRFFAIQNNELQTFNS